MTDDEPRKEENPFTKGSEYRVTSLGTQNEPVVSEGEFLGFTQVGMSTEGLTLRIGGKDGHKRVIPLHMVLHVDVVKEATEDAEEEEETHHYYT